MQKLGLGIMAAAAAFSIAAFAQSGNNASQICKADYPDIPHDVCVACVNDFDSAICQCKYAEVYDPVFYESFSNLGQCVSYLVSIGYH